MEKPQPITKNLLGVGGGALLGNQTHDFESTTTLDTYEQVGEVFAKEGLLTTRIQLRNVGGGGAVADVRVLGSLDGGKTFPVVVVAEQAINDGDDAVSTITDYYTHLKVEAKSNVAGTPTDVEAQAAAIAH